MVPLLCLCGASAAGKTTVAQFLKSALSAQGVSTLVVSCDDYYWPHLTPETRYGYDTPACIDTESLRLELDQICRHQARTLRRYDMVSHALTRSPLTDSYDLVVLEGSFGPQALLGEDLLHSLVYLELGIAKRLWRRLWRDLRERQHSLSYFLMQTLLQTLPGEHRFVRPLRSQANLIIQNSPAGLASLTDHALSLLTH